MYKDERGANFYTVEITRAGQRWTMKSPDLKYFNEVFAEKLYKTAASAAKALHRFNWTLSENTGAPIYALYSIEQ